MYVMKKREERETNTFWIFKIHDKLSSPYKGTYTINFILFYFILNTSF